MICSMEDCERIASLAKNLLAERKKYERRSNARHDELSSKQAQKLNVDLNWAAMEIDKIERQLHVACVDAGIADLREPSHYTERHYHPSGWHHYTWTPPQPAALTRDAA